ncbi:hypothetical protein GCWU000324_00227 [Kingella oralis ATCC 51147]|uniref:Uncharacterized protein n=1 Tax=Kingella oralis ATCC 51147 TaxID=629741 RepID=C4GH95_9NEIS|nr:hypothetical protein GCWU000324_00227 [Kingella oralis ATCC 51147]
MFGDFFGVFEQIPLVGKVLLGCCAAQPCAGDGAHHHFVALAAHQNFGRRADDVEIAKIVVKQIRRGVERAQGAVKVQGVVGKRQFHALRGNDLHAVAVEDVFAHAAHIAFEGFFAGEMLRHGAPAAERERDGHALAQFFAQAFQLGAGGFVALRMAGVGIHNQVDFAA